MAGEFLSSGKIESSSGAFNTRKSLAEIAKKHGLNEKETDLFVQNITMVSRGINEYFGGNPEDGIETMDVWLGTLDMYMTIAPKIVPAIAEALAPFVQALTSKEPRKKRRELPRRREEYKFRN